MTLALLFLRRHFRHLFHDCFLKLGLLRHELVHARIARMRVERVGLWPPPFIVVFATQDPFLALGSGVGIFDPPNSSQSLQSFFSRVGGLRGIGWSMWGRLSLLARFFALRDP